MKGMTDREVKRASEDASVLFAPRVWRDRAREIWERTPWGRKRAEKRVQNLQEEYALAHVLVDEADEAEAAAALAEREAEFTEQIRVQEDAEERQARNQLEQAERDMELIRRGEKAAYKDLDAARRRKERGST